MDGHSDIKRERLPTMRGKLLLKSTFVFSSVMPHQEWWHCVGLLRQCGLFHLISEVYAGITIDRRTDLHIIQIGPLTSRRYRDESFRPIIVPCTAAIEDDVMLMANSCRTRANFAEDFWTGA
ncbi:hypothetical protein TNCV_747701 [Trichonephila clavipes]|nr:hypothetical protein TNCV_747701 [Trichonephila clavipes]